MQNIRGKYAIAGIGEVTPPKGVRYPSFWGMAVEAAAKALEDAGLTKKDIDGVVFHNPTRSPLPSPGPWAAYFCQYAGINPAWYESVPYGGMPGGSLLICRAAMGIESGLATTVLVISVDNQLSMGDRDDTVAGRAERAGDTQYGLPYGTFVPAIFGMIAHRHMFEFGTTSEQMAAVSVAARKWASLNPIAYIRNPITIQDVLNSRMIASPIHLLDMCIVSDGGAAAVVTSVERAKDLKKRSVVLMGFGEAGISRFTQGIPSLTNINSVEIATKKALAASEVKLSDIDVVYPYDPCTITLIFELEQMGFCKKGEGGSFVGGGRLEPGGKLPVNTHGGLMSCRHPGNPGAIFHTMEAIKQLRGDCGERQVKDAELAITLSEGGFFAHNVSIFRRL